MDSQDRVKFTTCLYNAACNLCLLRIYTHCPYLASISSHIALFVMTQCQSVRYSGPTSTGDPEYSWL